MFTLGLLEHFPFNSKFTFGASLRQAQKVTASGEDIVGINC